MTNREVYEEKRRFVQELSAALSRVQIVDYIEYKNLDRQYMEFVRMVFIGGKTEYINVTGNSLRSILIEISRVINRQAAIGAVSDLRMQELVEHWWSEAV